MRIPNDQHEFLLSFIGNLILLESSRQLFSIVFRCFINLLVENNFVIRRNQLSCLYFLNSWRFTISIFAPIWHSFAIFHVVVLLSRNHLVLIFLVRVFKYWGLRFGLVFWWRFLLFLLCFCLSIFLLFVFLWFFLLNYLNCALILF